MHSLPGQGSYPRYSTTVDRGPTSRGALRELALHAMRWYPEHGRCAVRRRNKNGH